MAEEGLPGAKSSPPPFVPLDTPPLRRTATHGTIARLGQHVSAHAHAERPASGGMAETSTPTGAYAFRKRTRAAVKDRDDSEGSDDSSGASLSEHDPTVEGPPLSDESIDEEARTTKGRGGKAAAKKRAVVKETPRKTPGKFHARWREMRG